MYSRRNSQEQLEEVKDPISRTSSASEGTMVDEAAQIKAESWEYNEKDGVAAGSPSKAGLLWAAGYILANCLTTATISHLSYQNGDSKPFKTTLLLPPVGFAFTALLSRIPLWLPSTRRKSALERLQWLSGHDSLSSTIKHALPPALSASVTATTYCMAADQTPVLLLQALPIFATPIIYSILPFLSFPIANQPLTLIAILTSASVGFALDSFQAVFSSTMLTLLGVLYQSVSLVTLKRWSHNQTVTPGVILTACSPIAFIASSMSVAAVLPISEMFRRNQPDTIPLSAFAFFAITFAAEQICLVNMVSLTSLTDLPLVLVIKALLATVSAPEMVTQTSQTMVLCLALGLASAAIFKEWFSPTPAEQTADYKHISQESPSSPSLPAHRRINLALLLSLLPLSLWVIQQSRLPSLWQARAVDAPKLEIVVAYYQEPINELREQLEYIRSLPQVMDQNPIFTIYAKASENEVNTEWLKEQTGAHQILRLANYGREGGTYMRHIISRYNASLPLTDKQRQVRKPKSWLRWKKEVEGEPAQVLADHTMFLQAHLSWGWISRPRMALFGEDTGYLAFGPYVPMECGHDTRGNGEYPRMAQVYSIFREELCPKKPAQLGAYAAQFVVSKQRIMANALHKYEMLDQIIEAGDESWIHEEGADYHYMGSNTGASNPFFGHALERSWPVIFDCTDASIAERCGDEVFDKDLCQCFDERKTI